MEAKLLSTAKIGRTHGIEGFLNVYSLSGEYAHIRNLKTCIVHFHDGSEKSLDILKVRVHGDHVLLLFSGYETPEKAKCLTNGIIKITRDQAPRLRKGEFYVADLFGCEIVDADGNSLGIIRSVFDGSQSLMFEVQKHSDGRMYLVPDLPVYVGRKMIDEGKVVLLATELLS